MAEPQTEWQRVVRDVCDRILDAETPVGSKIATYAALAARNDVATGTVKRALDHLEQRGVIEGVKGSGTFVRREPTEADYGMVGSAGIPRGLDERLADAERRLGALEEQVGEMAAQLAELSVITGMPDTQAKTSRRKTS